MSNKIPLMNLEGAMGLIKKSAHPLAPLYEAMTNSLESIAQRTFNESGQGKITVKLHFTGLIGEIKELEKIEVVDNGIGFTEENYKRFIEFFDKSKGYDNRGSGRLQYLHRFEKIEVSSIYLLDDVKRNRLFIYDAKRFISNESDKLAPSDDLYTTKIVMSECLAEAEEKNFFDNLSIDNILKDIRRYFLLRFYLDNQKKELSAPTITVIFIKNGQEIEHKSLLPSNMPKPQTTGNINVPYMKIKDAKAESLEWVKVKDKNETIKWAHFKIPEDELYQNGVYLCSKDIPVQSLTFNQIKKKESVDGFRYLTAFYGDVLDKSENVSDSVDSFNFPKKKNVEESINDLFFDEKKEYLLTDNIKEKVNQVIPSIYKDVFDLKKEKVKDIESIAKAHGIPLDVASKANINLTDDEKTITKKIYSEQSDRLAAKGFKVKKLYESLKTLNPTSETYQEDLKNKTIDLSNLVGQQNKEELSRYIIRREMVTEVLKKILSEDLDYQKQPKTKGKNKDREGLIHDLIIKRKSGNTEVLNDLWILNEEFVHFDGCSELQIKQIKSSSGQKLLKEITDEEIKKIGIKSNKRPDIFLFPEEGKCVLIELKEPLTDMSDHLQQLPKYCQLIANYSVNPINKFYCYLVGEKVNPLMDLNEYEESVTGDWIKSDIPIRSIDINRTKIATAQMEVIKLSSLHSRAHRRNQSFAEKLGLPELLNSQTNKK